MTGAPEAVALSGTSAAKAEPSAASWQVTLSNEPAVAKSMFRAWVVVPHAAWAASRLLFNDNTQLFVRNGERQHMIKEFRQRKTAGKTGFWNERMGGHTRQSIYFQKINTPFWMNNKIRT